MHRPRLILRRFGPLTFGLGYYDDGVWVDHQPADDGGQVGAPMDAIHDLLPCCGSPDATDVAPAGLIRLRDEADLTARSAAAR